MVASGRTHESILPYYYRIHLPNEYLLACACQILWLIWARYESTIIHGICYCLRTRRLHALRESRVEGLDPQQLPQCYKAIPPIHTYHTERQNEKFVLKTQETILFLEM